ncbi:hypothetical protein V3C99_006770 [Haemonchus contortus]
MPAIAFIGNGAVVYVTIRSKTLRSPCNMLIALVSLSDMIVVCAEPVATIFHNIVRSETVPRSICTYLELPSMFAACTSPMFLLATTIDRRLCIMTFYDAMISSYSKYYLVAQILPGCILAIAVEVIALKDLNAEEQVMCSLESTMMGTPSIVYVKTVLIVCLLIILCNGSFLLFLRKLRMSSGVSKSVHRSVFIICMTVVLSYFSAVSIFSLREALDLDVDLLNWSIFTGLFCNLAYCFNFFVYYINR